MAYDPNDPEDKKVVQALIDEAVEAQREAHEQEIERLKGKNEELLGKLRKAREGKEDAGEVERLERELSDTQSELRTAQSNARTFERDLRKEKERADKAEGERDTAISERNNEFLSNTLSAALVENKVAPHFMDAATALLKDKHKPTVEVDGDTRKVLIDGKEVGEFVKEWAASDAGKHYVQAPANGGGGAPPNGGGSPGGLKPLAEYTEAERLDMSKNRPDEWKAVLAAAGQAQPSATPVIQ